MLFRVVFLLKLIALICLIIKKMLIIQPPERMWKKTREVAWLQQQIASYDADIAEVRYGASLDFAINSSVDACCTSRTAVDALYPPKAETASGGALGRTQQCLSASSRIAG